MSHVSLQEFLKTEPDGTLEAIAEQYNTTLLEVVKNLLFQPTRKARHVRAYQSRKLHAYCLDRT